ncbi:MAG: hypothetical protein ACE5KM_20570 [Planctomycetaceae bacterium]
MTVVFRSAKERYFRGAKGDYATVIVRTMLTQSARRPLRNAG